MTATAQGTLIPSGICIREVKVVSTPARFLPSRTTTLFGVARYAVRAAAQAAQTLPKICICRATPTMWQQQAARHIFATHSCVIAITTATFPNTTSMSLSMWSCTAAVTMAMIPSIRQSPLLLHRPAGRNRLRTSRSQAEQTAARHYLTGRLRPATMAAVFITMSTRLTAERGQAAPQTMRLLPSPRAVKPLLKQEP